MNQRLLTILLSAFLLAAGASYVVYRLVGKQINQNIAHRTVKVVVALRDLQIGDIIKAADVKMADSGAPPKDAVLKLDAAVGRGVLNPIYVGELVNEKRLAPLGSGGGLAATIPDGMRACAVKVNDVVGLAGFVLPGMRVDVLISGSGTGTQSTTGVKVKTLLQNIQVLSAGTNYQKDNEGKPEAVQVVNLLVTPEQAELLSLANNETRIQLVLRNPADHQIATPPGTELASLFGSPESKPAPAVVVRRAFARPRPPAPKVEPPAPPPPPPPPFVVQILNGGKQTEQKFAPKEVAQ